MPRKARLTVAGAVHHLMSRGNGGMQIFIDNDDRCFFLWVLEKLLEKSGYLLYAWCLMDNHYHVLIRTNEYPLGAFMRMLNGRYAQYFRKKSETRGYLFQDRYKSIVTQDQNYIEELVRYIHLNPVRAGICAGMKELDCFPWTGHSVIIGNRLMASQNTIDIKRRFGGDRDAIKKYREFLQNGMEKEPEFYQLVRLANNGTENVHNTGSWVIGNKEFVTKALAAQSAQQIRCAKYVKEGVDIEEAVGKIVATMNCSIDEIKRRGRNNSRSTARKICAYILNQTYAIPVIQIARYFNISSPAVSMMVREGEILYVGMNG
jgi:putative transposase